MTTIKSFIMCGDRYHFDFDVCNHKKGWAQLDTREDASYYGHWVNPTTLEFKSYVEGDLTEIACHSDYEFVKMMDEWLDWAKGAELNPAIDGMCNDEIIAKFESMGLGSWLH